MHAHSLYAHMIQSQAEPNQHGLYSTAVQAAHRAMPWPDGAPLERRGEGQAPGRGRPAAGSSSAPSSGLPRRRENPSGRQRGPAATWHVSGAPQHATSAPEHVTVQCTGAQENQRSSSSVGGGALRRRLGLELWVGFHHPDVAGAVAACTADAGREDVMKGRSQC